MMPAEAEKEPEDDRRALERLCVATRAVRPVQNLLRLVAGPDGVLTPDLRRRLPGRGVWVTATRRAVEDAIRRKAFARALKRPVETPADLPDRIEALLERACIDMLSMANKAGLVAPGFSKTQERIEQERAVAILQAVECSRDGARKVAQLVRRTYFDLAPPILVTFLTSGQISLALGRADVVHAALGSGPATTGFLDRIAALRVWREGEAAKPAHPHEDGAAAAPEGDLQGDDPGSDDFLNDADGSDRLSADEANQGNPSLGQPAGSGTE